MTSGPFNAKNLKPGAHIYFMGIGGTGMAPVAGLCKEAGFKITGSDKGVYPPMSEMLENLKIPYKIPYSVNNVATAKPDLIVVANALSRGNEEIEYMLEHKLNYTSFPALLGDSILLNRTPIVVAGTHGKTTTTSICTFVLEQLGLNPGFLIGGLPRDFEYSFRLGRGEFFVLEGDEYDTAFFDKGPKFLHYRPQYVIFNNLEFDHADIYKNVEEIEAQFAKLCQLVANKKHIIANIDDPGVRRVLQQLKLTDAVTTTSTKGETANADVVTSTFAAGTDSKGRSQWRATFKTKVFGSVEIATQLAGAHNIANIAQIVSLLGVIASEQKLGKVTKSDFNKIAAAIAAFSGVKRRLDHLGSSKGVEVYEDFAHHPTAIRLVIQGFRKSAPERKLIVAFEPANATGRRNVFQDDFASALSEADEVLIGKCPVDLRIPENERMNTTAMVRQIGGKARAFAENTELLDYLVKNIQPGSAVIFMSPSSFSGIQHQLVKALNTSSRD